MIWRARFQIPDPGLDFDSCALRCHAEKSQTWKNGLAGIPHVGY